MCSRVRVLKLSLTPAPTTPRSRSRSLPGAGDVSGTQVNESRRAICGRVRRGCAGCSACSCARASTLPKRPSSPVGVRAGVLVCAGACPLARPRP